MAITDSLGLLLGAVALGAVHGVEPGHGWPVAASYALDRANKWVYGFAASFILGVGHLVSSIAMVAVFFYAKEYFDLTQVNEPIAILGGVRIGGPVSLVAGVLLVALGIREYFHGHSHGHGGHSTGSDAHDPADGPDVSEVDPDLPKHLVCGLGHDHAHGAHGHDHGGSHAHGPGHGHSHEHEHGHGESHTHHGHTHGHESAHEGRLERLKRFVPFVGGHSHGHSHEGLDDAADRGLLGIAWFAFVLGFAHEEEFEIIALCAGSDYCLELMAAYAITVIVGIVGLTMALIAGYERFEEQVEAYTPYLPVFSAAVLVIMGLGFVLGLF